MVCSVVVLTDVEVEGVRARTIVVIAIVVGVSSTQVVVYIVPSVLLASILVIGVVCAVIDCEVKSVDVGAS